VSRLEGAVVAIEGRAGEADAAQDAGAADIASVAGGIGAAAASQTVRVGG
jgi:hypothetical protein